MISDLAEFHRAITELIANGFCPIPVPFGQKRPNAVAWNSIRVTRDSIPKFFPSQSNVGIILGDPSGGAVDIDIDSQAARIAADVFLPETNAVYGRTSNRRSHRLYCPDQDMRYQKFGLSNTLIEIRTSTDVNGAIKAHQSLVPPSFHGGSKEYYEWEKSGPPAKVDSRELLHAVLRTAITAALAELHPAFDDEQSAARQEFRLAVTGILARHFTIETARRIFTTLLSATHDPKLDTRLPLLEATFAKLKTGSNAHLPGIPSLKAVVGAKCGEKAMARLIAWIAIVSEKDCTSAKKSEFTSISEVSGVDHVVDKLLEFPRLIGPIDDLARGITSDLSYEHKVLCVLVYLGAKMSGKLSLASDPFLQPRFYGCMVGPPYTGKSSADKEVRRALLPILNDVHFEPSIDSGPALVEALGEHPRLVYTPDEMANAFEKARPNRSGYNSLSGEFLGLYESNSTGRRVLKKNGVPIALSDVHFSMIGSATPERFDRMWDGTSGASGGLQSRFVLSHSLRLMPVERSPNQHSIVETAVALLRQNLQGDGFKIKMTGDAQDAINDWSKRVDLSSFPRVLDMAKRCALLLSVSQHQKDIDGDIMSRALKFADYQIGLHQNLMPQDSSGCVQAFENRIISYFKRHNKASGRDLRRSISPEKFPGGYGAFAQAYRNLQSTQKLVEVGKTNKNQPIWTLD